MNNQANKSAQKEDKKFPENNLKDIELSDLNDEEFKIAILKNNEMQEDKDRQLNDLSKNLMNKRDIFYQRD